MIWERFSWEYVQRGLYHRQKWVRALTLLGLCLAFGLPVGAIIGLLGGLYGSVTLVALAVGYLMLRSPLVSLVVLIGIICLLPFAALPVDIGFSPTLLDLALVVTFFVWLGRLVTGRERGFIATSPTLGVVIFILLAIFSFVAGLGHAPLTANVLRHFVEILLSISIFILVINVVRKERDLYPLVLALILAGFAEALIGVVLYVLPKDLSVRLLSLLRVVRYPAGSQVLRYVEDNPELPLRAVATSIDPNVLGGLLIFTTTITAAQALAAKPLLPRKWLVLILVTMGLCMVLTFSRGAFVGLFVALLFLGLVRYRRILWLSLAALAVMAVLPPAQAYVQHFIEGLRGQDLATQMRFGEYKDALTLISRYPWFGVGFAGTPDIDTYLGVSSVYLLIAEEMGVVGLVAFLGTLAAFLVSFFQVRRHCSTDSRLEPIFFGTCAAVAGAMVGGAVDHYLFNLDFPHAAALLWLTVGIGTASIRLVRERIGRGD